jgi:hypothetical protein
VWQPGKAAAKAAKESGDYNRASPADKRGGGKGGGKGRKGGDESKIFVGNLSYEVDEALSTLPSPVCHLLGPLKGTPTEMYNPPRPHSLIAPGDAPGIL